jgi:hypothetical protein
MNEQFTISNEIIKYGSAEEVDLSVCVNWLNGGGGKPGNA